MPVPDGVNQNQLIAESPPMPAEIRYGARRQLPGLALAALLLAMLPAQAQDYPSRPVRIVVPFAPAARPTSSAASWRSACKNPPARASSSTTGLAPAR